MHIRYFWQGNHQIYGHIRCIYTVLANPTLHTVDKLHLLADPDTTSAHARARSCPHPAYTLHTSHTRFSTGLTHPASSPTHTHTHTLHLLTQEHVAALIQPTRSTPHTLDSPQVDTPRLLTDTHTHTNTTPAHARGRDHPHPAYTLHTFCSHTRFSTGLTHPASSPTHTHTTSAHTRARSCPHPAYTLHTSHTRFSTGLTHPASSPTHTLHLLMQGRVAALIQSEPNAPSHTLHT